MWSVRHETMTRDECRKCLRCLELDAYGSMVSVLRAQGPFTNEKQRLLEELAKVLHISNERHRAEVRRAVNDEKLATIAKQLNGPNTGTDWSIEGRRIIPLLPRLKGRSAFTTLANSLSLATTVANKRNLPVCEKTEDAKDIRSEPPVKIKAQETLYNNCEFLLNKDKLNHESVANEEFSKNKEVNNQSNISGVSEKCTVSEKRKPSSPLQPLPNKVLIVSSNSVGALNHGTVEKGSHENTIHLSRIPTNQLQNVTVIPLNINCGENITDPKQPTSQESASNNTVVSPGNLANTVIPVTTTNITKAKGRIITTQNIVNTKIGSAILISNNVSCTSGNNLQSVDQGSLFQDNLVSGSKISSSVSHNLQKTSNMESSNSGASHAKRIVPVIHSNVKPSIVKTVTSSNSHQLMAACPITTVSNGPGPPQAKQVTTLTCKKLSTTINNQTTAKMGVTLTSNATVNIAHHPDAKLGSKTNVIVIQKGQTKGVTLSHAGKEVLGTMIMGGKSLCVTSQHNASVNMLPRHITLNNGDQAVTVLSTTNSSHTESVSSNIKSGNAIMFNLRQDVLDKSKPLSHLFETSNVLTSDSKTVIQNTNARLSKEPSNSDLHVLDKELVLKTDAVITTVKDEKHSTRTEYTGYSRTDGTRKLRMIPRVRNKLKKNNNSLSFNTSFSRKSNLKILRSR